MMEHITFETINGVIIHYDIGKDQLVQLPASSGRLKTETPGSKHETSSKLNFVSSNILPGAARRIWKSSQRQERLLRLL